MSAQQPAMRRDILARRVDGPSSIDGDAYGPMAV
jgi:hypothetical protein